MSRTDPRPHLWKVQGDIPHKQHIAWHRARAQANFRNEPWELTFEDFQSVWAGHWEQRGKSSLSMCMSRDDPEGAWAVGNVSIITRIEHLKKAKSTKIFRENMGAGRAKKS